MADIRLIGSPLNPLTLKCKISNQPIHKFSMATHMAQRLLQIHLYRRKCKGIITHGHKNGSETFATHLYRRKCKGIITHGHTNGSEAFTDLAS